jgi:hypothetical protein
MFLFDYVSLPLTPDSYRITASTQVQGGDVNETFSQSRFFDVVGPRFALSPADVGGVFPPRNGRGPFEGTLPHIAIKRRTLPWERKIDDALPHPAASSLPADYPVPWVALLLFKDGEYTLLEDLPLENAVPDLVFQAMGRPSGIRVTAVEADRPLVNSLMPSIEELQLLTHVRWVNKDDRELSVEGSDGWFSVVMGNRLPQSGEKFLACLVSLERRSQLVPVDPPSTEEPSPLDLRFRDRAPLLLDAPVSKIPRDVLSGVLDYSGYLIDAEAGQIEVGPKARLVVLYSWQFTCEGEGTFRSLMQGLDVGMIGKPDAKDQPQLTDTGHMQLALVDRAGADETVWYRGPLVPYELTRDPLGPYHSADQARRVAPDTGAEDISYATAFEVGRLLAAADGRLAQELMGWRREAFRQSSRSDVLKSIQQNFALELPAGEILQLHSALQPALEASVLGKLVEANPPVADPTDLDKAGPVIGLNPTALREAWGLASNVEAEAMLGASPALGAQVVTPGFTPPAVTHIEDLAANPERLEPLETERELLIDNIAARLRNS